ncbi:MAG TPA: OB-fold nucleic acid binding domain-containing protein [Candidatus Nanoarchaeia archaeon]|nr:OB-fold nucleic acid binding domain-containing protein [Candidatus Nanoarchaeia archaeon]
MYKIPLAEIKQKILTSGKLTLEELEQKLKAKINELSGLISEEGAAHIIANELGVELVNNNTQKLKVKEIYAGMRSVTTVGKVVRKFEVREFSKDNRSGKVCSLILGDETGTVRVVFWNDQVDALKKVSEGDILLVQDGYARENNNDREVHLGNQGSIVVNPEGESVHSVREGTSYQRRKIEELRDGEGGAEIMGTVVQIFDPRFFNLCSQCNKKVVESAGNYQCNEHGSVKPVVSYVMNLVLDDGTGNIRSVLWKNQTNHLLGKTEEEISRYKDSPATFEDVKADLLGEQLKLLGQVKKNDMFSRLEFNVQMVSRAKPEEEIARLEKR